MKILITTPGLKFGGAERVLSVLSNQWVEMGCEVSIFITVRKDPPAYDLNDRVEVCFCGGEKQIGVAGIICGIRSYVKEVKPDVVLVFMQDVAALTAIALMGMGIPIVYSERNDPNRTNTRRIDRVFRKIVESRAKRFVFQTEGAKNCFKKSVQAKSQVILNPLDVKVFPTHDFSCEANEIVAVGRLERQKNYPVLVQAFSQISAEVPEIQMAVYGEGSLRDELEAMLEELGLKERVLLKGEVRDIRSHIKDAQAFVMSSDYEGLPNALMEALAMGLPCVSTDCSPGGAKMLIEDGVNGFIVPCGDAGALSAAMKKVLLDRQSAQKMGNNALKLREQVDSKEIAKKWMQLFEEIVKWR